MLERCRRWEDVLSSFELHANDAPWGAGAAVEAVCRCAQTVSLFDGKVQSKSRSARNRGDSVRRDPRYAALSAGVLELLPRLDLHRLVRVQLCA